MNPHNNLFLGGVPCAADRTIGTLVGLKAAEILLSPEIVSGVSKTDSWLVGMKGGEVTCMDLMEAVNLVRRKIEKPLIFFTDKIGRNCDGSKTMGKSFPITRP